MPNLADFFTGEITGGGALVDMIILFDFALALLILSESQITILPIILIGKIALWVAGILTLYTGFDYLRSGLRHL